MGCRIKICGITRESDVELVCGSGADYIGLLVNMPSPRTLDPDRAAAFARIARIPVILLFMNADPDLVVETAAGIRPAGVQIQGVEPPEYIAGLRPRLSCEIWKGVHMPARGTGECDEAAFLKKINKYHEAGADRLLLDTVVMQSSGGRQMGGTGKTYDWEIAARLVERAPCPVFMAGGLSPDNVADAIRQVRPFGVDLASGVESARGIKDPDKVAAFVANVRSQP